MRVFLKISFVKVIEALTNQEHTTVRNHKGLFNLSCRYLVQVALMVVKIQVSYIRVVIMLSGRIETVVCM